MAELLVSAALSLFVLGAVYGVFRAQSHSVKGQESRMEAREYALSAMDMMVREIRNTGYFPTGTACTNIGNTSGVVSATAQSFRFVYDANGDGVCEEDITYTYDSVSRNITRNPQVLTDGNVTGFQFTYFPQQTSGTPPAALSCNPACSSSELASIQRVAISVTVQSKSTDVEFGGQANITMSSDADLRNRGLSS